jgi:hypothetical protein
MNITAVLEKYYLIEVDEVEGLPNVGDIFDGREVKQVDFIMYNYTRDKDRNPVTRYVYEIRT